MRKTTVSVVFSLSAMGRAVMLPQASIGTTHYRMEQRTKTQGKRLITLTFSMLFKADSPLRKEQGLHSEETIIQIKDRLTLRETAELAKNIFNEQVRPEYEERKLVSDIEDVIMRISYRM